MSKFTCIICGKSVYADHDCKNKILTGYQPTKQAEILKLPNGSSDVIPPIANSPTHDEKSLIKGIKSLIKGIKILLVCITEKDEEIFKLRGAIKEVLTIANKRDDHTIIKILQGALDE